MLSSIRACNYVVPTGERIEHVFSIRQSMNYGDDITLLDGTTIKEFDYSRTLIVNNQNDPIVWEYEYYVQYLFNYEEYKKDCENKARKARYSDYYDVLDYVAIKKVRKEGYNEVKLSTAVINSPYFEGLKRELPYLHYRPDFEDLARRYRLQFSCDIRNNYLLRCGFENEELVTICDHEA